MVCAWLKPVTAGMVMIAALAANGAFAESKDLGNGFRDCGVPSPMSKHRGTVATVDGEGRNVVLLWLFDHRGGYALLMIDAETGETDQIPMPFKTSDCPFSSILSSKNKFYTHFGDHFVEFDPAQLKFTFCAETVPQMAMSMTEDDNGVIWSVTYPKSGVASFNPETREFKDYGHVHEENWAQYQRSTAADDKGWIYFGVGNTASQIIIFDPKTGTGTPVLPESERVKGSGVVTRATDGKVYAHNGNSEHWYLLHEGKATRIDKPENIERKPIITSHQGLFHTAFPDGKKLVTCDLIDRVMSVEDPATGETKTLRFDYTSDGCHVMGLATSPDGTIVGGTAFPMRFFSYNPKTDTWINEPAYGQFNTVVRQGGHVFFGGYGGGFLLEWDPAQPWVDTVKGKDGCNPQWHIQCTPPIHRPHDLLAHPDGKTIVLAGTPGYGYTGGGLLFWDRETNTGTLIEHTEILPEQSTNALVALPGGKILGGTTVRAGTGGEEKAEQAEMYIMDMASKKVEWHEALFPGARDYLDLYAATNGLVYGVEGASRFFVFDPVERKVIHEEDTADSFGSAVWHQGPRVFVQTPDDRLYMIFRSGIVQVDQKTHALSLAAKSPVTLSFGGDYLDGRLYFGGGSHVYSYELPE